MSHHLHRTTSTFFIIFFIRIPINETLWELGVSFNYGSHCAFVLSFSHMDQRLSYAQWRLAKTARSSTIRLKFETVITQGRSHTKPCFEWRKNRVCSYKRMLLLQNVRTRKRFTWNLCDYNGKYNCLEIRKLVAKNVIYWLSLHMLRRMI